MVDNNEQNLNTFKEIKEQYKKYNQKIYNNAGIIENINFITKFGKEVDNDKKKYISTNINRIDTIDKINKLINNINDAILIEAGIYEFTLVYSKINKLVIELYLAIYNDKLYNILNNLDKKSHIFNEQLVNNIKNKSINLQNIPFMTPQKLRPELWKEIIKKKKIREYKKNNKTATDLYKCYKCGERKCQITPIQTRSADEPTTLFITCLECYHTFKQ